MPALAENEVYQAIKPVDIGPVLQILSTLQFIAVGLSKPSQYKCDVMLSAHFPPAVHELVAGLGLGGTLARAILRRLEPRQSIPPHIDDWVPAESDWRRFQVPLVTDQSVIMRWPNDGVEVHLAAGNLYEVRFNRTHEVINGWDGQRIHLQVDQINATI